jgi:hypothetical protein
MTANLTAVAPILLVSDLPASVAYWRESVGFAGTMYGVPPDFAILRRDAARLMLALAPVGHTVVPHWRVCEKMWDAYFWVDDAKSLYEELRSRGARIDYELYEAPHGVLEFGIQDLDEHDIAFGETLG